MWVRGYLKQINKDGPFILDMSRMQPFRIQSCPIRSLFPLYNRVESLEIIGRNIKRAKKNGEDVLSLRSFVLYAFGRCSPVDI